MASAIYNGYWSPCCAHLLKGGTMKKTSKLICLALAIAAVASAQVNVVATLPWIGSIAKEIGKEFVSVTVLVKTSQDPHYVEAKPSFIAAARKADVLIYNGLDLEIGYLPVIIETSKNPRIQPGRIGNLDCSRYVVPVEKPTSVDRSMGDIHPLGNPHYQFSPVNILHVAEGIAETLAKVDPKNETFYKGSYRDFQAKWEQKVRQWDSMKLAGRKFIAYHNLFSYLTKDFGVQFVGYVEAKPGIPPSAKDIERIVEVAKRTKPEAILTTTYSPRKEVQSISEKTGIKWVIVPHDVGATSGAKDWFSFMDEVISILAKER